MSWEESDVRLVPVEWLKAHEEIKVKNMEKLLEMTLKWDGFTKPLIADKATGTILDGHHRFAVAKRLELARIPAVCIDYLNDDTVELELCQHHRWSRFRSRTSSIWPFHQTFILLRQPDTVFRITCLRFTSL